MYETTYHRPSTVDEAAALFAKGSESKYLAGGHTLIPVMKQRTAGSGPRNSSDTPPPKPDTPRHEIRIIRGPHDAPPLPEEWEVTPELNRIGIRFRRPGETSANGEPLPRGGLPPHLEPHSAAGACGAASR